MIYPNPAGKTLHIRYPETETGRITYQVYDLFGQVISEGALVSDSEISLEGMAPGVYFISFYMLNENRVNVQKFVKQ